MLFLDCWYVLLILGLGRGGGWGVACRAALSLRAACSRPDRHIGRFCLKTIYQYKPVQSRSREWAAYKRSSYALVMSPDVNTPDYGEMETQGGNTIEKGVALLTQEMMGGQRGVRVVAT